MPRTTVPALRLAARFRPLYRSADRLVLASEDELRLLERPLLADVVEALYTAPDAALDQLGSRYPAGEISGALDELRALGILAEAPHQEPAPAAYWDSIGCPAPRGEIAFEPLCPSGSELIAQALRVNGLTLSGSAPFLLATVDDYLHPKLSAMHRRGIPWMLAKPVGHTIWIGPIFVPGKTACWECLASWLKPHRWPQAAFSGWTGDAYPPQPSFAALPTTIGLAAGMIATAASVWLARGEYPQLEGSVMSFDTRTLRQSFSVVRPRPDCPHCKPPAYSVPCNLRDFVSPITGIVAEMESTAEPAIGLYHARALFAAPLPTGNLRHLPWLQHAVGRGPTREAAETICLAESLERYSLVYQGSEPATRARIDDVGGLSPTDILLFSDAQYRTRDQWNPAHGDFQWVPEPFDPAESIEWTEAHSLVSKETRYLPTGLCYMHYPFAGGRRFSSPDTNGCAAGRTRTEALVNALLELVERDAVAIWWYNRLTRPAIDLSAFDDAEIKELQSGFAAIGRSVHVLDITTDIGIPAYAAIAPLLNGSQPAFAAAASLSPRRAAYKAMAEVAQICFWSPRRNPDGDLAAWLRTAHTTVAPYLAPRGMASPPPEAAPTGEAALERCVSRLQAVGIEPLYVDITRPEIGLPVVRAYAPGLRHFWARFAPGRLYSVPLRMGWLDRQLQESELNPTPCMI